MNIDGVRDDWRFTTSIISGGHFFSHLYFLTFPPLFPLLAREFSLSNTQLGIIMSIMAVGGLLQMPIGEFVDRTGAKRIFLAGMALTSAGIMLTSLSSSYLVLLAFVTLSGLGQAAFHPSDYAMLSAVSSNQTEGKAFSLHMFSGYIGFAVAPLIVGGLSLQFNWRIAVIIVGSAGIVYTVFAALTLKPHYLRTLNDQLASESDPAITDRFSGLLNPGILTLFLFTTIIIIAQTGIQSFTPILGIDAFNLTITTGNTALTGFLAAAAVGVLIGGPLADRYRPSYVIGAGLTVAAIALSIGVSGLIPVTSEVFLAIFIVAGGFTGAFIPARDRLISTLTPSGSAGKSFGFVLTGLTIGAIVGPALFGAVIDVSTVTLAFIGISITYLISVGITIILETSLIPSAVEPTDTLSD